MPKTTINATPKSLSDYVKAKRRAACVVCKLSETIREQIRTASDKGHNRRTVLEWLQVEVRAAITEADLATHASGKHED